MFLLTKYFKIQETNGELPPCKWSIEKSTEWVNGKKNSNMKECNKAVNTVGGKNIASLQKNQQKCIMI